MGLKMKWIDKLLETVFVLSIAFSSQFYDLKALQIKLPWYPILMCIAIISGVTKYSIVNESKQEIKLNIFFPFFQSIVLGVFLSIYSKQPFDASIITNLLNTLLVIGIYVNIKKHYSYHYKITNKIGKLLILDYIVLAVLWSFLVIKQFNILTQVLIMCLLFTFVPYYQLKKLVKKANR